MLRLLCGYIDVTKFENYMFNFLLRCVFKNFSDLISIAVTQFILRQWRTVCCLWNSLEQVWGRECAAGGFVVSSSSALLTALQINQHVRPDPHYRLGMSNTNKVIREMIQFLGLPHCQQYLLVAKCDKMLEEHKRCGCTVSKMMTLNILQYRLMTAISCKLIR
jgi:hypothetical protein